MTRSIPLTLEAMQSARDHFIDLDARCIADARAGEFHVNDLESYTAWMEQSIADTINGKNDHTFTFRQMAYYFQTGECVPLLGG